MVLEVCKRVKGLYGLRSVVGICTHSVDVADKHGFPYSSSMSSKGSTPRASVSLRIVAMCAAVASFLSSLPI